jgi:hypothetical protein
VLTNNQQVARLRRHAGLIGDADGARQVVGLRNVRAGQGAAQFA